MHVSLTRRRLLAAGCTLPLLALPGCATRLGDLGLPLEDAIRRILTLSSQRAFAQLLTEEGFFRDELARVTLPSQLAGSGITSSLAVLLGTSAVQEQLLRLANSAAREGAEAAAPLVYDSIRDLTITDALSIVRGGSTAATAYLEGRIGDRIFDAMFPQVGGAMRGLQGGALSRAVGLATGIDFTGLQADIARKGAQGIWRAIGREEASIRANPQSTGDPVLTAVFGLGR